MKYGFVRARALSPKCLPGDPAYNAERMKEGMAEAAKEGVELLVFPELSVTGYTCGDLFGQKLLINAAEEALKELIAASEGKHMLVFAGVPVAAGADLFNCAAAFAGFSPPCASPGKPRWSVPVCTLCPQWACRRPLPQRGPAPGRPPRR